MNRSKLFLMAGLLVMVSVLFIGASIADQSDAVSHGTADNPLTSLTANLSEMYADSDKTYYIAAGSTVTLTGKTTYPSYEAVSTTGGTGITVNSSTGTASGTMPSSDVNVICMYKANSSSTGTIFTIKLASASGGPYQITTSVTPSTGGTITPSSASVEAGGSQKFVINAASGSYIYQVYIDGNTITPSGTYPTHYEYTFTNVNETHNIGAAFYAKPTYTVTINAGTGGSVNHSSITNVPYGSSISVSSNKVTIDGMTVTATASTGYSFSSWSNTSGTITSNRTITANFTANTYTVTINAGTGGSVSPTSVTNVPYGTQITVSDNTLTINGTPVTATASTGYSFSSWSNASGTITSNRTITANFTSASLDHGTPENPLTSLTANLSAMYADPDKTYYVAPGASINLIGKMTYPQYYGVTTQGGTGLSIDANTGDVTGIMPDTEVNIYCSYHRNSSAMGESWAIKLATASGGPYEITTTVTPSTAGTITPSSASVEAGGSQTFIINAASGSYIYQVYVDGNTINPPGAFPTQYEYTFTNVNENHHIGVAFYGKPTYTVTINAGTGGSVSPTSITGVPYGTQITVSDNTLTINGTPVTATPDEDYIFSSWTNATEPIVADRTITANFSSDGTIVVGAVSTLHGSVTVSSPGVTSQTASNGATATIRVAPGAQITFSATVQQYYTFLGWETGMGSMVSTDNPFVTSDITIDTTIYAGEGAPSTVTIQAGTGGSVSPTRITNVPYATTINVSGNTLTINGTPVTATPDEDYIFSSWTNATEPIVADRTITANFSIPPIDTTWWSNDQYNGQVDILFKFGDSDNKVHTLNMDLYTPTVSEGITTWNLSGFSLTVSVSYPSAQITASLSGGTELSKTVNPGKWSTFIVSIDSDNGTVSVTPIKTFESFTNYTIYEKQTKTVLDFSAQIDGAAVYTIGHTESATGENSPRFQVVSTNVFLNTYGVVLYNPTINLFDYWPQYESLRVNFYSFALYGESITINGTTYQVTDGKITIQYVSSGDDHYLPGVMPNATVQTRTFNLDNIYVTYQDNHAYLTFVPERFTLDLGSYTAGSETISMSGLWYFASMVYEPYTVMEKHLSDWKTFPETSSAQMLLIFIAILIVAGAFVALHIRRSGLGWIDLAIIGCAAVVAFIMLG